MIESQAARNRYLRLSTTPFGVVGAGWVVYSVAVLGAVYGFLFLPPRGWALLHVVGALVLLVGLLVAVSELIGRASLAKLDQELSALPFPISGYTETLTQQDADSARMDIRFAKPPAAQEIRSFIDKLDAPWLDCEFAGDTVSLLVNDTRGEGTNWRLNQRLRTAVDQVCVPSHKTGTITEVVVSSVGGDGGDTGDTGDALT